LIDSEIVVWAIYTVGSCTCGAGVQCWICREELQGDYICTRVILAILWSGYKCFRVCTVLGGTGCRGPECCGASNRGPVLGSCFEGPEFCGSGNRDRGTVCRGPECCGSVPAIGYRGTECRGPGCCGAGNRDRGTGCRSPGCCSSVPAIGYRGTECRSPECCSSGNRDRVLYAAVLGAVVLNSAVLCWQ